LRFAKAAVPSAPASLPRSLSNLLGLSPLFD
jgi:hypothetical protein